MLQIFIAVFKVNINHHKMSQVQVVILEMILGHLCKKCGRGQPRGRRARGRGRGISRSDRARGKCVAPGPGPVDENKSTTNILPPFAPQRPPGNHFPNPTLRGTMTTALDFFRLFFTVELMHEICQYTNDYDWNLVVSKPYYSNKEGAWCETNPAELDKK